MNISIYNIKQKISDHFSNVSIGNSADKTRSSSCPPSKVAPQIGQPTSAFSPFKSPLETNRKAQIDYENYVQSRGSSLNKNSFDNAGHGLGSSMNNQHLQSSNAINHNNLVSSGSASYLSGPSGHSGGEASASHNQHHPSTFLSPTMKPQFQSSRQSKQFPSNNFNLGSEIFNDQPYMSNIFNKGLVSSENKYNQVHRH